MNTAARAIAEANLERDSILAGLVSRRHFSILLLAFAVFLSGFAVIYLQDLQRRLYIDAQNLTTQANQMQTDWGRLLLEQSTWSMQGRIEDVATNKFNMVLPDPKAIVMVQD